MSIQMKAQSKIKKVKAILRSIKNEALKWNRMHESCAMVSRRAVS